MIAFLDYVNGTNDFIDISNIAGKPVQDIFPISERLVHSRLVE